MACADNNGADARLGDNNEERVQTRQVIGVEESDVRDVEMDQPRYREYARLDIRVASFENWTNQLFVLVFAAAGFFYAGYEDVIRCHHCGLVLRGSDSWVNVNTEHYQHSPACQYIQQHLRVEVFPYQRRARPAHPEYRSYVRRLISFLGTSYIHPENEMAYAGFFYDDNSGLVRCFHCGLTVGIWRPGEGIYTTHRLLSPDCEFLHMRFQNRD